MAKSAQELEQEFLATIVERTGRDLEGWMEIIAGSGENKTPVIVKHLKGAHGLNHLQATMLVGIYQNDGKPVYDYEALFNKLFEGMEHQLPLYRKLEAQVQEHMPEVKMTPTKTYVSIDGQRCFATAKTGKNFIRIGLDLGDRPFDDYVEKARSLGAMPRISHMIELHTEEDVNDRLLHHLRQAYHHVHG
jgi:hypothetical protein